MMMMMLLVVMLCVLMLLVLFDVVVVVDYDVVDVDVVGNCGVDDVDVVVDDDDDNDIYDTEYVEVVTNTVCDAVVVILSYNVIVYSVCVLLFVCVFV